MRTLSKMRVVSALCLAACSVQAKLFQLSSGTIDLKDVSPTVEVYYQSMRFNRAKQQWNFDLTVRNTAVSPLTGPVVVLADGFTNTTGLLAPDGRDEQGKAYVDITSLIPSGGLLTGQSSAMRTLTLGVSSGAPNLSLRVYATGNSTLAPALAFVRTLDGLGQPLPGVAVVQKGPTGDATNRTDGSFGVGTLGMGSNHNVFSFSAPGYLPVWREQDLVSGSVIEIPSPRLVKRGTNSVSTGTADQVLTNGASHIQISLPAVAFSGAGVATLTALSAQTLPALLPRGWSPLQAFWLELTSQPGTSLAAQFDLWGPIHRNETAALVRWDDIARIWRVTSLVTGLGSATAVVQLTGSGAWTLVVPDATPAAPPGAVVGQPILPAAAPVPDYSQMAISNSVTPGSSIPSKQPELVTAIASLVISNATGPVASGTLLRAKVREHYQMRDGSLRVTPSYETWFVGYQRPDNDNPGLLKAAFPLRPLLLLGGDELSIGTVNADILPPTAFAGAIFDVNGGNATNANVKVGVAPGVLSSPQAVQLEALDLTNFASVVTGDLSLAVAFQLTIGALADGSELGLQISNATPGKQFVLARVLSQSGVYGLQPVGRLTSDTNGVLTSTEPGNEPRLSGLVGAGQFVLTEVSSTQALVEGIARNSQSNAVGGLVVRLGPWTTLSRADGSYRLPASVGEATLAIVDPATGDAVSRPVAVPANQAVVIVPDQSTQAAGPTVLAISPTDASTNVALVASVTITFSKQLNPATVLGSAVQLLAPDSNAVPISVAFNLRGDQLTLLPLNPLLPQTNYRLTLSQGIADLGGRPLVGQAQFSFSTVTTVFSRDPGAQLITYEPTNGVMKMKGTAGFSQPGQPVVLVNETSGRTATALAQPDGSFSGELTAESQDQISVTVINGNGSRDRVTPNRQLYADGSTGLFAAGGTVTVQGENGPIDFTIEPGAIASQTRLKFEPVPLATVLNLVSNTQPEGGRILGGTRFSAIQGSPLTQRIEVSFPVKLEDMNLPAGTDPTNCGFGLAIARIVDGDQVFELVDRMHYENGKLVTHSPPFFGLLGPFEDILVMPLLLVVGSTGLTTHGQVYAVQVDTGTGHPAPGATKEFLPGALVSGKPASTSLQLSGRLRPGTVFTVAGPDGKYTLLVSLNRFDPARALAITATHPRFPGVRPETQVPDLDPATRLAIGDVLLGTDVYFPLRAFSQRAAPVMAVSQSPDLPAVGSNVTVTVLSTDNDSTPDTAVTVNSVVSLVPGVTAVPADVTLLRLSTENPAPRSRRDIFNLTSTKAAQVALKLHAADADGNISEQLYPVLFGTTSPTITNDIPVADTNDIAGPMVIASDPSEGSSSLAPAEPISLLFSKPIHKQILQQPELFAITPDAGTVQLSLSADQTRLIITYPLLAAGSNYTLSVHGIKDLAGHLLDQDPTVPGAQGFTLNFALAPFGVGNLTDTAAGTLNQVIAAGTLIRGNYAYVLERRGTQNGRLAVFDLSTPSAPALVGATTCPAFPRDLVLIPRYSFAWTNGLSRDPVTLASITNVVTRDVIGIVGGLAGEGQLQSLRLIDISEPTKPTFLAGAVVGAADGLYLPTRVRWSPPVLAYLEVGQPSKISIVNLQEFLIGELLVSNQQEYLTLPPNGRPGIDLNSDGDYVDPGEFLPLPAREPLDFAGKDAEYGAFDTDQLIRDFAVDQGGNYVGAVLDAGHLIGPNGLPLNDDEHAVLPTYRTIYSAGLVLERTNVSYAFSSGLPRRVTTLFQFPLVISNQVTRFDLALVGVRGELTNRLTVLDVTDRLKIKLLTEVELPKVTGSTNIDSILQRDDGLLVVASDAVSYLLDPSRFLIPPTNGIHPALVGLLPAFGGSAQTIASTELGFHLSVAEDGTASLVQTAPKLRFVSFPPVTPFNPATLVGKTDAELQQRLAEASPQDFLYPSRFRGLTECATSTVTNLDPASHYYVLVEAPGGSGATIDLAVESLNGAGHPLADRGFLFPPVHCFAATTLQSLLRIPGADDAPVRPSRAWRLSNDPKSPYFNVYLSRPIVLLGEEMSKADLTALDAQLGRDALWSGNRLRASFDPSAGTNSPLALFAGQVTGSDRQYKPGAEAVATCLPADYLQSPSPGPVAGAMNLPLALHGLAAHSGELTHEATDLEIPGRRLGIHFKRTYAGQGLYAGIFGRGWDFNYNQRLVELSLPGGFCLPQVLRANTNDSEIAQGRDILFYTGAGRIVTFKYSGSSPPAGVVADPLVQGLGWFNKAAAYYLPPSGLFSLLLKFKDGSYARLEPDGTQYWYSALGRLTRIYDRFEQNSLQMVYNQRGELIRIYDELSRTLDIGYYRIASDPLLRPDVDLSSTRPVDLGKVCRLKDYSNRDILFEYSDDGLLARRLGPEVDTIALPESFTGRQITRYIYSDSSNPGRSAKSLVAVIGDDAAGVPVVAAAQFGDRGRDSISTLQIGSKPLVFTQTHNNTARDLSNGGGRTQVIQADSSLMDMRFDAFGRVTNSIYSGSLAATVTNSTEYYTNGLLKAVTYPEGNRIEYYYDDNNPVLRSRANLVRVRRLPGPRGGPVLEATTQFDSYYNLAVGPKTDFNGNTSVITLRADHLDTDFIDNNGLRESFEDNDYGQLVHYQTVDGVVHEWQYDDLTGFLVSKTLGNNTITYGYAPASTGSSNPEQRGLATSETDANGITKANLYDERGQLIQELRGGLIVKRAFDASGRPIKTVTTVDTGRQLIEESSYNQLGFVLTNIVRSVEVGATPSDLITVFVPDDLNRVKEAFYPAGDHHIVTYDHLGRVAVYQVEGAYQETRLYDGNGNLINRSDGLSSYSFRYDGHDRLVGATLPNGSTIQEALDGNGNVLARSVRDVNGTLLFQKTNSYDALNRLTATGTLRDDGTSLTSFTYKGDERQIIVSDALKATQTNWFDSAGRVTSTSSGILTITNLYDGNGNVLARYTIEGGHTYSESYRYNELNYATNHVDSLGKSLSFSLGVDGRLLQLVDREGFVTTNTYTLLGEKSSVSDPNGVTMSLEYDRNRRLTAIHDATPNRAEYHFDAAGRRLADVLPNQAISLYTNFNAQAAPRQMVLPVGITAQVSYDASGKITNRVVQGPSGTWEEHFAYDGLDRSKHMDDPNSSVDFDYDLLGYIKKARHSYQFRTNAPTLGQLNFELAQQVDAGGFRSAFVLPAPLQTNGYGRDLHGRLISLSNGVAEPIIKDSTYAGVDVIGRRVFGNDRVEFLATYDGMQRPVTWRYRRLSDGQVLADTRYAHDRNGYVVGRQYLHRGGKADLFTYDHGYRLVRADLSARPLLTNEVSRTLPGFAVPTAVIGSWAPGTHARVMHFDSSDLLSAIDLLNPDSLSVPPLAGAFANIDTLLFSGKVDGFVRQRDEAGNIKRTQLLVRIPGKAVPELVAANLGYDNLGRLVSIVRDDGVRLLNEYDIEGNRIRCAVIGDAARCVPSDIAFIYDGTALLEERDLARNGSVKARYYHGDDYVNPVAVDLDLAGNGTFGRYYFLTDPLGTVEAIADGTGSVVERINYDVWGQPILQSADTAAPRVSLVTREGGSLVVQFTEPVLPPAVDSDPPTDLASSFAGISDLFVLQTTSGTVSGTVAFDESRAPFGCTFRFTPAQSVSGNVSLKVKGTALLDEWHQPNPAESLNVDLSQPSGSTLFSGPASGSTAPQILSRGSLGLAILFHGQVFDYDSGLLYCHARFYDPYTAQFLQRDPSAYSDSVNQYAAFSHNPVNLRDPLGMAAADHADAVRRFGKEAQDRYWFPGAVVNVVAKAVAWFMEIGTGAAEGWDLLNSDKQGTFGLIDRLKGAQLVIEDGYKAAAAAAILHAAGSFVASKVEGYRLAAMDRKLNLERSRRLENIASWHSENGYHNMMLKRLVKSGMNEIEAEANIIASETTGVSAHVRYNDAKAAARVKASLEGFDQKPGWTIHLPGGGKTDPATGTVRVEVSATTLTGEKITRVREFVSDLDYYAFSKGGRLAKPKEIAAWHEAFKARFDQLKLERNLPQLKYPIMHEHQLDVGRTLGQMSGGKKVNNELIREIAEGTKGGGTILSISPAASGRAIVKRTPDEYVNQLVDWAEPELIKNQRKYGEDPIGFHGLGPWRR
jgi:RHS repeat-associated protein